MNFRRRDRNPAIRARYGKQEACGYLAQLLAAKCHLAGLKQGHDAPLERAIGCIRHDVPVDAIAKILTELAAQYQPCACAAGEDDDVECTCTPGLPGAAHGVIRILQDCDKMEQEVSAYEPGQTPASMCRI